MLVTSMETASSLTAQPQGVAPHAGLAEGTQEILVLLSAGLGPSSPVHRQGQPKTPGCQKKEHTGPGSSWETPAAACAHGLEPTLLPSSPRFLWGQDFRLGE